MSGGSRSSTSVHTSGVWRDKADTDGDEGEEASSSSSSSDTFFGRRRGAKATSASTSGDKAPARIVPPPPRRRTGPTRHSKRLTAATTPSVTAGTATSPTRGPITLSTARLRASVRARERAPHTRERTRALTRSPTDLDAWELLPATDRPPLTALRGVVTDAYPPDVDGASGSFVILGAGGYGVVYASGAWAVKLQRCDLRHGLQAAVMELDRHATLVHPAIMHAVAWGCTPSGSWPRVFASLLYPHDTQAAAVTFLTTAPSTERVVAIVMPRGTPLVGALRRDAGTGLTLEAVIADTLSAVAYMHERGLAHADIKVDNMTLHDGVVKLLDLGLARPAPPATDGRRYFHGAAYTGSYCDPEYTFRQWNPLESDLYALARAWWCLSRGTRSANGQLYTYRVSPAAATAVAVTAIDDINDMLDAVLGARVPGAPRWAADRPSAQALLDAAPPSVLVCRHHGAVREAPLPTPDAECGAFTAALFMQMYAVAYTVFLHARTLFLAAHNLHRALPRLLPGYSHPDSAAAGRARACAMACLYLAAVVSADAASDTILEQTPLVQTLAQAAGVKAPTDFLDMVFAVLVALDCHVSTPTYWTYASRAADLPALLDDTVACAYDATRMRRQAPWSGGGDKDILVRQLPWHVTAPSRLQAVTDVVTRAPPSPEDDERADYDAVETPIARAVRQDVRVVEATWRDILQTPTVFVGKQTLRVQCLCALLHNRDVLNQLTVGDARAIVELLLQHKAAEWAEALDVLLHYSWRTVPLDDVPRHAHLFTVTDADIVAGTWGTSAPSVAPSPLLLAGGGGMAGTKRRRPPRAS